MGKKEDNSKKENNKLTDLLNEYRTSLEQQKKELEEKEKSLEVFSIRLNEKEEELLNKEKAIQGFLKEEIESQIENNNIPKEKRKILINKVIEEILLSQIDEAEETEEQERKFLRNEYQKLKHSLFHEMVELSLEDENDEDDGDFDINDTEIERIKQELKEELDFLEKRHPSQLADQKLLDLSYFDEDENKVMEQFKAFYEMAKVKYSRFILLTFVAGKQEKR